MELRHLRYFLAVARELNFTRAARHLNMAQPPLTQQIKALEAELGVMLFDRSAYRIKLTEPGQVFLKEAERILGEVRSAVLVARRAARGTNGQLRVGFTESSSFNPLVMSTLRTFRSACPDVEVSLEESQSTELALGLHEGRIDVAFLRPPLPSVDALCLHILQNEDMVVVVPREHRLAKRKLVALEELAEETFVLYPRAVRPGLADAVVTACMEAGFTPRVEQYAPQMSSTINLVAASMGISIVPRCMQDLQPRAVSYIPLRGRPVLAQLGIAHRNQETSAIVLRFIALSRKL